MSALVRIFVGALALIGCVRSSTPSSALEPTLGRSQPLPSATTSTSPVTPSTLEPSDSPQEIEDNPTTPEQPDEPTPTVAPPAPVTQTEEQLCRHITSLVHAESKRNAGLSGDQLDELIASCSLALAHDRRKLGEDEFHRRADCVRKATSTAALSACGDSSDP
jgi:cytoskeletal protein RodZ